MATSLEFTASEKQELQEAMPQIENLLKDSEARNDFFHSPLAFLRQRFRLKLLDYIARSKDAAKNFEESVRDLFDHFKKLFTPCFACKLAALIIIYGILAKYDVAVSLFFTAIDKLVGFLGDFFEGTSERADEFLAQLEGVVKKMKPSGLALEFCRFIGICKPLNLEGQLVDVPLAPMPA